MANHKRKRPKKSRAGCLLCKPYKRNGVSERDRHKFSLWKKLQDPVSKLTDLES